jgi:hypothetical protein
MSGTVQPQLNKEWLRSSEVRKMLGISHGTLQNLRIKNILPHRKIGGPMYYKYQDILKLLEDWNEKEHLKFTCLHFYVCGNLL